MKISLNKSACFIYFEENDKYCGKKVVLDGERDFGSPKTFYCLPQEICFSVRAEHENYNTELVHLDKKEQAEVLQYILEHAKIQGYNLLMMV